MKKIRMRESIASADWSYAPRQVLRAGTKYTPEEVPAEIAAAWEASGIAEPVDGEEVETATAPAAETAARPRRSTKAKA